MKKLLLSAALVVSGLMLPFGASAYTVNQLATANQNFTDKEGSVYATGIELPISKKGLNNNGDFNGFKHTSSGQLTLEKLSYEGTTYLFIDGMFNGNIYVPFTVNGSTIRMKDPGGASYYANATNEAKPMTGEVAEYSQYPFYLIEGAYWGGATTEYKGQNSWTGTISEEGNYYVIKMNPLMVHFYLTQDDLYYDRPSVSASYDGYEIHVPKYTFNADVTDNFKNVNRKYKVNFNADFNDNTFEITNLTNNGFGVEIKLTNGAFEGVTRNTTGRIDPKNKKLYITAKQPARADIAYSTYYGYPLTQAAQFYWVPEGASQYTEIEGSYDLDFANHKGASRWHKNSDGELATYVGMNISFGNIDIFCQGKEIEGNIGDSNSRRIGTWKNTKIDAEVEYTANPDFNNDVLGYSNDTIAVYTQIVEQNEDYVDHYEVIVIPGVKTSIKADNDFIHKNHGHNKAFNLSLEGEDVDYISNPRPSKVMAFANDKGTQIEKQVTFDKLRANNWNESDIAGAKKGQVSYFIKTVYNNGMEPSYHALKAPRVTTGINDIATDNNSVYITTAAGAIVVEGAEGAQVEVYTAAGVEVYAGADSEIAVEAGLYIVKVGSKVQKVVVR